MQYNNLWCSAISSISGCDGVEEALLHVRVAYDNVMVSGAAFQMREGNKSDALSVLASYGTLAESSVI